MGTPWLSMLTSKAKGNSKAVSSKHYNVLIFRGQEVKHLSGIYDQTDVKRAKPNTVKLIV